MKKVKYLLFLISLILHVACGFKVSSIGGNSKDIVSGVVSPLVGLIASNDHSPSLFINKANAATCLSDGSPVLANLYQFNADGTQSATPLSYAELDHNAKYSFDKKLLSLTDNGNVNYVVEVKGCGATYTRPITALDTRQDVDARSTAIGLVISSTVNKKINQITGADIDRAIALFGSSTNMNNIFSEINANAATKYALETIFNDPSFSTKILVSAPKFLDFSAPEIIAEATPTNYSVTTFHWNPNYDFGYEWRIGSTLASSGANYFTYTPSRNDQGIQILSIRIGKNNGSGGVDTSTPFTDKTFSITVQNTFKPVALAMTSTWGSNFNSNPFVDINVNTGVFKSNCDTFSSMAITVNTTALPIAGDFTYLCTNPVTQTITNLYLGAGEGTKTIRMWTMDDQGVISLTPTILTLIQDTVPPTLSLTNISTIYKGGATSAFNYSAIDLSSAINNVKLYYAVDGVNFSLVKTLSNNGNNDTWVVPSDNATTAKLKIETADTAGNISTLASSTFTVDSIPPGAPVMALVTPNNGAANSLNLNFTMSNCNDTSQVYISQSNIVPLVSDSNWKTCSTTVEAISFSLISPVQGLNTLYSWSKDNAGNISLASTSLSVTYDTVAPTVALSSAPTVLQGAASYPINYSAADSHMANNPISISYSIDNGINWNIIVANTANNSTYNWTVPSIDNDQVILKVTAIDKSNQQTSAISALSFTIDSTPPIIDSLTINSGATTTTNNNVQVTLNAHDMISNIKYFCLKYDNPTQPAIGDSCWKDVTAPTPGIAASKNISFSNFYYQIGFTKGPTVIYAWVKDNADKISNNMSVQNTDSYSIYFDPGTPPKILEVQVTNSNTAANPILSSDMIATNGSDIYIKWNASDTEGLDSAPISIHYTTNDTTFIALSGGSDLLNGANGTCTVDSGFSGCVKLTSPANGYFKIRVIAKDTLGSTVFLNSAPMNENKLKILAGNTDDGLDGSALTAVFNVWGSQANETYGVKNRLVVSEDGKFFYIDLSRGLLWIDPSTGVLKKFINITGTSSGDGGNVSSATLKQASAIALDSTNNLLIWDLNRIRKVNLATMTISTIIGGGANADPLSTVDASTLQLNGFDKKWGTFIPLPNGDVIFTSPSGTLHQRRYRANDNKVELMDIQGAGYTNYPADIWSDKQKLDLGVVFDSINSQIKFMVQGFYKSVVSDSWSTYSSINFASGNETTPYPGIGPYTLPMIANNLYTGLDGKLYLINRFRTTLHRYNYLTNTNTLVLGTGAKSAIPCPENTLATSCPINIDSVFISKIGRIYFVDNGVIRTIDDNNKVISLFGQFPSFGNGSLATTARFGQIMDINMGKSTPINNKVVIQDNFSDEFREFTIDGTVGKLGAVNFSWHGPFSFEVDPTNGDILSPYSSTVRRLDRTTLNWSTVIGGGTTAYHNPASDGLTGANVNLVSGYHDQTNGLINNKLYYQKYYFNVSVNDGCYVKSYDTSDLYRQAHFMGNGSCVNGITNGGVLASNAVSITNISKLNYFADPVDSLNKLFLVRSGTNTIYSGTPGGTINLFRNVGQNINSFTHKFNTDGLNLYFCSTAGYLYKHIYNTSQTVQLPWLSPTIKCKATRTIIYNSERNSLIFPFTQNGLDGVAEYDLNP